ncbi:MAG: nuclear transport factor 2 family protein [Sphingomonadaceae bacterium]
MMERKSLADIADLQAIQQRLAQHSRGIDRADAALLTDCYHPDATVDYGFFKGTASALVEILIDAQTGQPVTLHRTAQMWIRLNGNRATSESYVVAYFRSPETDGAMKQRLICGRYLDRLEKREGIWRLSHRTYVLDTNANWPDAQPPALPQPLSCHVPVGGQAAADTGTALLALAAAQNRQNATGEKGMTNQAPESPAADAIDTLVSRQQIADLTMAYCRGVDRADEALLKSIFHEDSTVVSGAFNGNGHQFASEICRIVKAVFDQTFHSIANQWIEVTGDTAIGETYVIAVSTMSDPQDGKSEMLSGGRYIDRFTRRNGVWKFADRTFVSDWSRVDKTTREMDSGMYSALELRGAQGPDDPIYRFWN